MIILIGTKGQLIKMAPVMKELQNRGISYKYIQTNQHPQLNRILEKRFGIKPPDLHLWKSKKDLVKFYETPFWFVACFINALRNRKFFSNEKLIITHGDTLSTLFACIIGKLFSLKIAHVEAGLRSFNIFHPFPEEIIRRISSKMATLLFAPSSWAANNLRNEKGIVVNTKQNTVFDTLALYTDNENFIKFRPCAEKYVVAAIHRQETIYNRIRLKKVVDIILSIAEQFTIVYILHKTSEHQLKKYKLYEKLENHNNIKITGYLEYIDFMNLIKKCEFVVTDGGGLQEETYFLNVPCLLLRQRTEREIGLGETSFLADLDEKKVKYFLLHYPKFHRKKEFIRFYPSKTIVNEVVNFLKNFS
ncbi:MAG: UDP-N-acetylglucosamine 2-epimerase [candidate division WOR-3 bacterium]